MMVRCGYYNRLSSKRVEILDEAVHNAFKFSEFLVVATKFRDRVEFIQEKNARGSGRKIEKRPDVLRCAAEEGGDQAVESRNVKVQA